MTVNNAWDDFCDELRVAGQGLIDDAAPQDPIISKCEYLICEPLRNLGTSRELWN